MISFKKKIIYKFKNMIKQQYIKWLNLWSLKHEGLFTDIYKSITLKYKQS